jgi:hypothetical protein
MKKDRRFVPRYSYQEADRLAGLSRGTASRWLKGYRYGAKRGVVVLAQPVTPRNDVLDAASFVDLVELVAIGRFRRAGYALRSALPPRSFHSL